jgi:outer membrane protein assembly factor BamA
MEKAALITRLAIATVTLTLLSAYPITASAQEAPSPAQGAPPIPETATEAQGFIAEPDFVLRAVLFADRNLGNGGRNNGFYVDSFNAVPGAGWIAVGPGYRRWFSGDRLLADASASISWRGYRTAQATIEAPSLAKSRLTLGSTVRWQNYGQIAFYGEGGDSLAANASEYGLRSTDIVGYATLRPVRWVDVDVEVGVLNPSVKPRSGFFQRNRPDTRDVFPGDVVFSLDDQPSFVHSGASVTADTRDFAGHPTRGGVYRAVVSNYSDRDTGVFSFKRYEAEAAQFIPVADSRVVFALRGWMAASDTGDGQSVPFYLQPSLGGHNSLRGYGDYRFHDRNLLLVNAEARIAMMTHVDTAIFWDAGNVAARFGDLNLDQRSWGVGLRLHSRRQTYARFDVARGNEGWRFLFRMNDPLQLNRLKKRTATVPFAP